MNALSNPEPAVIAESYPDPQTGHAIGWDHARHGVAPPAALLREGCPVRAGFVAARSRFAGRSLRPSPHVRQWLRLRVQAWLHGQVFEDMQLTANHLRQICPRHCPVTRELLGAHGVPTRMRGDAAFAAGNMVMLSARAAQARAGVAGWQGAWALAMQPGAAGNACSAGLNPAEWARLALLMSFTCPLSEQQAATLPLLVLPPNRLRLFNATQGVQALLTRLLAQPGWTPALRRWAAVLGHTPARHELHRVAAALLPRLLRGNAAAEAQAQAQAHRQTLEDAWACELLQRRWQAFAQALRPGQAHALLDDARRAGWAGRGLNLVSGERATEGWALPTQGCVAPGEPAPLPVPAATATATAPAPAPAPAPSRSLPAPRRPPQQAALVMTQQPAPWLAHRPT